MQGIYLLRQIIILPITWNNFGGKRLLSAQKLCQWTFAEFGFLL
jgi:hypothetical protein